ncbi:hypothetical protein [Streptomyces umbrinus]|uniref:hypothetical protein n=1 Tax=Streptomyces umbrinus TaxID=67370 RepID=UPI00344564FB
MPDEIEDLSVTADGGGEVVPPIADYDSETVQPGPDVFGPGPVSPDGSSLLDGPPVPPPGEATD